MEDKLKLRDAIVRLIIVRARNGAIRGFGWRILKCPYCGKRHEHGGGNGEGNPRDLLGHRIAHCDNKIDKGDGYILVEGNLKPINCWPTKLTS